MATDEERAVDRLFEQVLAAREFRTVFQPIVELPSRDVVGYEALTRGPEGTPLASAEALGAAANRTGRVVEFDWAARASACRSALDAQLDPEQLLFLNIEPFTLDTECPADLLPDIERAFERLRVVLEVTERSRDLDPGSLLDGVERYRPHVAGIGLDDVGADPLTLALLPLVAPSVIKLDESIVHTPPDDTVAKVLNAIEEEAERAGAVVLAEGIETGEDARRGQAYGAQLGQGYLYGRPGPVPPATLRARHPARLHNVAPLIVPTPFDALSGESTGTASSELIYALTQHIESCTASGPAITIDLLPEGRHPTEEELQRLTGLSRNGTFTAILGPELPHEPAPGVRGIGRGRERLPSDQWAAITVGPCANAALLARRLPDEEDAWMYGLVHDRTRVIAAARSAARLLGLPDGQHPSP